jgi:thiol:disulfide interchange protein
LVEELGVVTLKADKTRDAPEVDALLRELGNTGAAIPFYAVFPGNGGDPIVHNKALLTQGQIAEMLRQAGPSKDVPKAPESMQTASANSR